MLTWTFHLMPLHNLIFARSLILLLNFALYTLNHNQFMKYFIPWTTNKWNILCNEKPSNWKYYDEIWWTYCDHQYHSMTSRQLLLFVSSSPNWWCHTNMLGGLHTNMLCRPLRWCQANMHCWLTWMDHNWFSSNFLCSPLGIPARDLCYRWHWRTCTYLDPFGRT